MKINEIMEKYQISTRALAMLIDVTPATINYWQKTHDGEIPAKFIKNVEISFKTIDRISELAEVNPSDICPLILEFRKSPFWRDWPHLSFILTQSLPVKSVDNRYSLLDGVKEFLKQEVQMLGEAKNIPESVKELIVNVDVVFQGKEGTLVVAYLYSHEISLKDILKDLSVAEDIHKEYPDSIFYFFAPLMENSIHLATENDEYIRLINYTEDDPVKFNRAKPKHST